MIGCAMKNREGDLRKTYNNLIIGDSMNEATAPHNFRFELTMFNNSDEWKFNIMLDSGQQPHITAVSPANIRYVNEQAPLLPKVNDFNCIENEFISPTFSAHGYVFSAVNMCLRAHLLVDLPATVLAVLRRNVYKDSNEFFQSIFGLRADVSI
eukprot:COSAG05_NODE_3256_length_2200_cov_1.449310_2_plen_153_part_00